jgi:antitoxin MazE
MTATIQKWGNSLALRLPKALATEAHIAEGRRVELVGTDEGVLANPRRKPRYRLAELLAGVTKKNIHLETDWGRPVGREILESRSSAAFASFNWVRPVGREILE